MASYVGLRPDKPTKYLGANITLEAIVVRNRPPSGADLFQPSTGAYYRIGTLWIINNNPVAGNAGDLYWLADIVANVAVWQKFATASGGQPVWTAVAGTSQTLVAGSAYVNFNSSLTTFTLPATAVFGQTYIISGFGSGGWLLAQNGGQSVILGSLTTTTGVTGSVASTNRYDTIQIVCITADTVFKIYDVNGNPLVT